MPLESSIVPTPSTEQPETPAAKFVGFGEMTDVGANWRIKFADADGIPLNMLSFEQIDFGAIAYKEIFQNVKTILATPKFSAALERLLGVDQTIVDLPIDQAAEATVAILDALYFWEPRAQAVNIQFEADMLAGHLKCSLQLKIRNVIYGTDQPYDRNNIFGTPKKVTQQLPPLVEAEGIPGPPGPVGSAGARGSLWFTGAGAPAAGKLAPMKTPVQGPQGPQGAAGKRGFIWLQGAGDPVAPQANDMYLNTSNGDVWQFDGVTWRRT